MAGCVRRLSEPVKLKTPQFKDQRYDSHVQKGQRGRKGIKQAAEAYERLEKTR